MNQSVGSVIQQIALLLMLSFYTSEPGLLLRDYKDPPPFFDSKGLRANLVNVMTFTFGSVLFFCCQTEMGLRHETSNTVITCNVP